MLTTIVAIAGLIFGFTAFVIGILNYRRDRPGLRVVVHWDSVIVGDKTGRQVRLGQVYVTNTGRRPVYITAAGIELWSTTSRDFIQRQSRGVVQGRKLAEGDPPICFVVPDNYEVAEALIEVAEYWRDIRAFAIDSNGKKYLSRPAFFRPTWGKGDGKASRADLKISWVVECYLERHQVEAQFADGEVDIDRFLGKVAIEFKAPDQRWVLVKPEAPMPVPSESPRPSQT